MKEEPTAMIRELTTEKDVLEATAAMQALRPQLNENNIVTIVGGMLQRGYHLAGLEADGKIVAAMGYRFTEHLHWGKALYIDDLSTLEPYRKMGYARQLLDYVVAIARANHCREVHLDSGCVPSRYAAHRLYLRYGFNITSHHFAMSLNK